MLARRTSRGEITSLDRTDGRDVPSRQEGEPVHLQPYPDRLLDELTPAAPGPELIVEQRESVDLAFVAAVQCFPRASVPPSSCAMSSVTPRPKSRLCWRPVWPG